MSEGKLITARARTDAQDRLIEAEEPLAAFHQRAGGEIPGPIVTPALLDLVRRARASGKRMSRAIRAQDTLEQISAWAEVVPGKVGTVINISAWDALDNSDVADAGRDGRVALVRHLAGLTARLDNDQSLITVDWVAPDLDALGEAMMAGAGKPWTDFARPEGDAQRQPLHWRLLDGAKIQVEGSDRDWVAQLLPLPAGRTGFELYLVPDRPLAHQRNEPGMRRERLAGIGREIAPVLRKPVSRIIANAETIRTQLAGPLADEYSNYAADIASAGEHLLALIDDLTTLEVVDDQDFAPAPDQIDLADVARRAAGILGVRAKERRITLVSPADGASAPAIGEFRRTLQVLLNLVGNAVRYSPEGATVTIAARTVDGKARITVADEGEGLSEEEQKRAFAKFERLGRQGDGGSGLGLYISRRLAEAMDGSLTVESAKGQGARFTLELPSDPSA
ncbi:sensor histidine kinase [Aurantiacibacter aquimixticola]|uniref:histidine kinase n=1 Tax=Aurantiacibacter aquimixticola TaxID=1958945 RepID=A0A419RS14_9SPHN|nr:HAMP domain-containing sensor histidine kinase [Aurantiacibacter aquimixticola]RJY08559.1 sensor histidine kinase [Aurantiacibacter aquimixticola]